MEKKPILQQDLLMDEVVALKKKVGLDFMFIIWPVPGGETVYNSGAEVDRL